MSLTAEIIWYVVIFVGLGLSALYSGLETGAYSLNRVRLHILEHRGIGSARVMHQLLQNRTSLLGTLLIGNNIANYMGTAGLAVVLEARGYGEWQTIIINALVITPLLFVIGETLPKDLFAAYADRLMYPFARFLRASKWLFLATGMLPLVNLFSGVLMRSLGRRGSSAFHPRRLVTSLVQEGVGSGILSEEQSAMVERVLDVGRRTVADEMTPWKKVLTVDHTDSAERLWELADRTSHSRFPVVKDNEVTGTVDILEALRCDRREAQPARLTRPVMHLKTDLPIRDALTRLQKAHAAIAVVENAQGRPVGVVTIKDLVEPITGELSSW